MMKKFEIARGTSVKILKVTPRHEPMGKKDTRPAISLRLCWETTNESLNKLHPNLRDVMSWRPPGLVAQETMEVVPETVPALRVPNIEQPVKLKDQEYTGYTATLDYGLGEAAGSEIELYECKQDKFEFTVKESGSAKIVWSVHSNKEITPELVGIIFSLEGQEIGIGLEAPSPDAVQQPIDGTGKQFNQEHPLLDHAGADPNVDGQRTDATGEFVAQHGGESEAPGGDDTDGQDPERGGPGWPFPDPDANGGTQQDDDGSREQAEIEAGMREAISNSGSRRSTRSGKKGFIE